MNEVKAVVFDWAGTMVDFGSCAPMGVFVEVFKDFGVEITIDEARGPMGRPKWDHIYEIGRTARVADAWQETHGRPFGDADVDAIYEAFIPRNLSVAASYADLIPGAADIVARLRKKGIKIGSTTGYTREIMAEITPVAAAQGYEPDGLVCFGDTSEGRPSPLMMYKSMVDLGVWPATSVVKVDDTIVGIQEGLEAGCWTVGISLTGNLVGLPEDALAVLSADEVLVKKDKAEGMLKSVGAHYVIDSVADLMAVIDDINRKLSDN